LLAIVVNDNVCLQAKRSALESIASKLAPTESFLNSIMAHSRVCCFCAELLHYRMQFMLVTTLVPDAVADPHEHGSHRNRALCASGSHFNLGTDMCTL
jgi:hypothetical protein